MRIDKINIDGVKNSIEITDKIVSAKIKFLALLMLFIEK